MTFVFCDTRVLFWGTRGRFLTFDTSAHSLNHRLFGVPRFRTEGDKNDENDDFRLEFKANRVVSRSSERACSWWLCMACGALREWVYRVGYIASPRACAIDLLLGSRVACSRHPAPQVPRWLHFPRCNVFFWGGKQLSTHLSFVRIHPPRVFLLSSNRICDGERDIS